MAYIEQTQHLAPIPYYVRDPVWFESSPMGPPGPMGAIDPVLKNLLIYGGIAVVGLLVIGKVVKDKRRKKRRKNPRRRRNQAPRRRPRARARRKPQKWIKAAIKHPGALTRTVERRYGARGFTTSARTGRRIIKKSVLDRLAREPGTTGKRARLAITLRKIGRRRRR